MVKIKPVLLDIQQPFPQVRSKSGERARQYEIVLGNNLVHELNILKMKHFAQELGYRFWILVCSKGYDQTSEDIAESDLKKSLILEHDDIEEVRRFISSKLDSVGVIDFDELADKLEPFLDASDIRDDEVDR